MEFDFSNFEVVRVTSSKDPLFKVLSNKLTDEFKPRGEMEDIQILTRRFDWSPDQVEADHSFSYEMVAVVKTPSQDRSEKAVIAVRDHTAIFCHHPTSPEVIIHLSHALIDPPYRGKGLAPWLRTWPIQLAKEGLSKARFPPQCPITLVAEMDHPIPSQAATLIRLKSYQRAGFLAIDPTQFHYLQPDFRDPTEIDFDGTVRPLPMRLVIRRLGREGEEKIKGSEAKRIVTALYKMYGANFRPQDMAKVWETFQSSCPPSDAWIALIPPIEGIAP